ncbi:MAG: hypothetical protein JXJ04_07625 [Spirochaetales bacterium]|nr:hypothetical protein [Spirochaetales bacterium]
MIETLIIRITSHMYFLYWLGGISLLLFTITMIAVPLFIIHLPTDFFIKEKQKNRYIKIHFILRLFVILLKNIIGIVLLIAGILMLVLPGQGLLTIFIGLILVDFPGKKTLLLSILGNPLILAAINWIRKKNNKKSLTLSHMEGEDS